MKMEVSDKVNKILDTACINRYEFSKEELENLIQEVARDCATISLFFYHPKYAYQANCGKEIANAIETKYGIKYE